MDTFSAIIYYFGGSTAEDVSVPKNEEASGSGTNVYCVIA